MFDETSHDPHAPDHVNQAETEAAQGHSDFRFQPPPQPDEQMIRSEEFDALREDCTRERQQTFQKIVAFILRGTRLQPQNLAARILILGAAFSPDAMAAESERGKSSTTLCEIGRRLGRTRAAISARSKNLEREISEMGGSTVRFSCSRGESAREASRLAAVGNHNRLGKPAPSRA